MRLTKDSAEWLAQKFRVENGLGATEAVNMKSLLRRLNILAVYRPLSEKAYGLSLMSPEGDKFMLVNCNNTRGRQHFTIAHELYHLFYDEDLHPHVCGAEGHVKEEKDADLFASALLMPRDGILALLPDGVILSKNVSLAQVLRLEQYFGVSRQSMLYRLKGLGLIGEALFQKLSKVQVVESAREYGYDLSLYKSGNEYLVIGDYGELARLLFETEKVSEGHYVELLNHIRNDKN